MARQMRVRFRLFLITTLLAFLVAGGLIAASQLSAIQERERRENLASSGTTLTDQGGISPTGQPMLGDPGAPVVMVEFADFYCPFCARFLWETFPRIKEEYIDKGLVRYEFRNLIVHGLPALLAAVAGECAAQQGRFWEFEEETYSRIFKGGERRLEVQDLEALAADIGLDEDKFADCLEGFDATSTRCKAEYDDCLAGGTEREECARRWNECMNADPMMQEITADQQELARLIEALPEEEKAQASRIGTPTFFINGHILIGAQPYAEFRRLIERELERARSQSR